MYKSCNLHEIMKKEGEEALDKFIIEKEHQIPVYAETEVLVVDRPVSAQRSARHAREPKYF